ncbi:uncharacterized protein LOC101846835 [Aplysia californica]|uniref:Uncharacterized protein LOC101846835 n=1 Tax=Aplysia californica TaxID=6500 RepID=A0ABM0K0N2_APLCA|nr:uncharacterized protein LOC101846835 [Aplysia californica]
MSKKKSYWQLMDLEVAQRNAQQDNQVHRHTVQQAFGEKIPVLISKPKSSTTPFGKMDKDGNMWPIDPKHQTGDANVSGGDLGPSSSTNGTRNGSDNLVRIDAVGESNAKKNGDEKSNKKPAPVERSREKRRSLSVPSEAGESRSGQSGSSIGSSASAAIDKNNRYGNFQTRRREPRRNSFSASRRRHGDGWPHGRYNNGRDVMDPWDQRRESTPRTPPPFNSFPTPQAFREWHGSTGRNMPLMDRPEWYPPHHASRRTHQLMHRPRERRNGVAEFDLGHRGDGFDPGWNPAYARHQNAFGYPNLGYEDYLRNPVVGSGWENPREYFGLDDPQNRNRYQNRSRQDRFQKTNSYRSSSIPELSLNRSAAVNCYQPGPAYDVCAEGNINGLTQQMNRITVFEPRSRPQSYDARLSKKLPNVFDQRLIKTASQPPSAPTPVRRRESDTGSKVRNHALETNRSAGNYSYGTRTDSNTNLIQRTPRNGHSHPNNIRVVSVPHPRNNLEKNTNHRENQEYNKTRNGCIQPKSRSRAHKAHLEYDTVFNHAPLVQTDQAPNETPSDRESSTRRAHRLNGLLSEVQEELVMAEILNLPFKRGPRVQNGTPNSSKLNPQASEFRPNSIQDGRLCQVPLEQNSTYDPETSRNVWPSTNKDRSDKNNNYIIPIESNESESVYDSCNSYEKQIENQTKPKVRDSSQISNVHVENTHQNSQFPVANGEFSHYQPVTVYNQNLAQANGQVVASAPVITAATQAGAVFMPSSTPAAHLIEPQTPQVNFQSSANFAQTPQVVDYQQMSVYNPPNCHAEFQTPAASHYVQAPMPQGFPQPGVIATPAYHEQSHFRFPENYQNHEQQGASQEMPPNAIFLNTPVIATPVGLYNGNHFTYQVASVPAQPVVNRPDLPLRTTQTEPRTFDSPHHQAFFQHAPVFNFQAYCMTVENDQPFRYPGTNVPTIEELKNPTKNKSCGEKKTSLMDRVGNTIKEVQASLKTSKTRRREGQESWEEILEKLIKLPPNFREPSDMAEYRQLRKLSEVISTYIKEIKKDSPGSLSESEIFQEVLDLSWPIASMNLDMVSGKMSNSLPEIVPDTDAAVKNGKSRTARMNRSRQCLQKAWNELAMTISRKCAIQIKRDGELTPIMQTQLPFEMSTRSEHSLSDELPQCDQVHPNASSTPSQGDGEHFTFGDGSLTTRPRPVSLAYSPAVSQDGHFLPQAHGVMLHSAMSGTVSEQNEHSDNRRDSLGGVNVGTRISYFESNAKGEEAAQRQTKGKK